MTARSSRNVVLNKSWYVEFIIYFFFTNELSHVYFSSFISRQHEKHQNILITYFISILSNLHNAWPRLPELHASSGIFSVAHHNPHINATFVFLLMQDFFVNKIHFFKFLFMSDKPRLHQLTIIISTRSAAQTSLTISIFPSIRGNTIKEGEILCVANKCKASLNYQAH